MFIEDLKTIQGFRITLRMAQLLVKLAIIADHQYLSVWRRAHL